jgi:hypothetical protein
VRARPGGAVLDRAGRKPDQVPQLIGLRADRLGDVEDVRARQDQSGAGVADDGAQPRERAVDSTRIWRIGRHGDDAGVETPEEGRDEVDAAFVQEEGPISRREALLERGRHALRAGVQGGERQLRHGSVRLPVVEKPQRQGVGPLPGVSIEGGADVVLGRGHSASSWARRPARPRSASTSPSISVTVAPSIPMICAALRTASRSWAA